MQKSLASLLLMFALASPSPLYAVRRTEGAKGSNTTQLGHASPSLKTTMSSASPKASQATKAPKKTSTSTDSHHGTKPSLRQTLVKKGIGLAVISLLAACMGLWIRDVHGDLPYRFPRPLPAVLRGINKNYLPCYLLPLLCLPLVLLYESIVGIVDCGEPEASEADAAVSPSWLGSFIPSKERWMVMGLLSFVVGYVVQNARGDLPYRLDHVWEWLRGDDPLHLPWYGAPLLGIPLFLLYEGIGKAIDHVYDEVLAEQGEGAEAVQRELVEAGLCLGVMCLLSWGIGWCWQDQHGDFGYDFGRDLPAGLRGKVAERLRWYVAPWFFMPFILLYEGVRWAVDHLYVHAVDDKKEGSQPPLGDVARTRLRWVVLGVLSWGLGYGMQDGEGDFPCWFGGPLPSRLQGDDSDYLPWYLALLLFIPFFLLCEGVHVCVHHVYDGMFREASEATRPRAKGGRRG